MEVLSGWFEENGELWIKMLWHSTRTTEIRKAQLDGPQAITQEAYSEALGMARGLRKPNYATVKRRTWS
jgi:hypothetical protein